MENTLKSKLPITTLFKTFKTHFKMRLFKPFFAAFLLIFSGYYWVGCCIGGPVDCTSPPLYFGFTLSEAKGKPISNDSLFYTDSVKVFVLDGDGKNKEMDKKVVVYEIQGKKIFTTFSDFNRESLYQNNKKFTLQIREKKYKLIVDIRQSEKGCCTYDNLKQATIEGRNIEALKNPDPNADLYEIILTN